MSFFIFVSFPKKCAIFSFFIEEKLKKWFKQLGKQKLSNIGKKHFQHIAFKTCQKKWIPFEKLNYSTVSCNK